MFANHFRALRQKGFSLVELLVALALSAILMAGIIEIYLENKRNYVQNEEYARLQENGRFALGMVKREVTMAGFFAGLPDTDDLVPASITGDCTTGNWAWDPTSSIELANNVSASGTVQTVRGGAPASTDLDCLTASELQTGSDVLAVKRTADTATLENGVRNVSAEADKQWYLRTEEYGGGKSWSYLDDGETIAAADAIAGSSVDYWELYVKIFYIRSFSSVGDGIPTLCVESLQANAFETSCYVEGVEDMQVEVGVDTDGDGYANRFVAAPTTAQLDTAVAIRVYLLVRSINEIQDYTNNKTYALGSKSVTANDGFLRQVYATTVLLRNDRLGI